MPQPPTAFPIGLDALRFGAAGVTLMGLGSALQKLVIHAPFSPAGFVFPIAMGLLFGVSTGWLYGRLRRSLATAEEDRQRYHELFHAVPVAITRLDAEGQVADLNRAAPLLYGWSREELLGAQFSDFVSEGDRPAQQACVAEARTRGFASIELNLRAQDGATRAITRHTRVLRGETGDFQGLLCVDQDLTARRIAERAAFRHLLALQRVDTGVLIAEADQNIIYVNPAFSRHLGLTDGVPATLPTLFERLPANAQALTATGGPRELRLQLEGRTVGLQSTLATAGDGEREWVLTSRDDSAHETLLAQLHEAQKHEVIGQLAGGLAHDFNNLLVAIRSYADLAASGPAADLEAHLAGIREAAEQAAALTRQLLAFARRVPVQPVVLDLYAEVQRSLPLLRTLVGERVNISVEATHFDVPVRADPGQLEQILVNLVVNARDAIQGNGQVTIRLSAAAETARLEVEDNGSGIEDALQTRVFEPFFTTKPVGEGTGLGLAAVHGIVNQHGGAISVRSKLGEGTTFIVTLPLTQEAPTGVPPAAASPPPREGTTVLLVEDNDVVRRVALRVLRGAGYRVLEARHAQEAIDQLGPNVQILFSDLIMPGMTGAELMEVARARHPSLKFLLTSGYYDPHSLPLGTNAARVLAKPYDPATLLQAISEALAAP